MTATAILGVATTLATGAIVFLRLRPAAMGRVDAWLAGACLSPLFGIAIHSIWYLIWLQVFREIVPARSYFVFDAALPLAAIGLARAFPSRMRTPIRTPAPLNVRPLWPIVVLGVAGAACIVSMILLVLVLGSKQPHGMWDAWAMWNLKARWFALGADDWLDVLTHPVFESSHPDYPLLLPLSIARFWTLMGGIPTLVPQAFSAGAVIMALGLLFACGWVLRGPVAAVVSVASLAILPAFLGHAAWQYADVPLSCFYAATVAMLAAGMTANVDPGWFRLAGIAAGGALWTKNEGLLFILAAVVALGIVCAREKWPIGPRLSPLLVGMAPFVVVSVAMRLQIGVMNDILMGQSETSTWQRLVDPARHLAVLRHGWALASDLFAMPGLVLFAGWLAASGRGEGLLRFAVAGTTVALTALGYYVVFIVTPQPLAWHLTTAADRLLLQLWPSLILTVMLIGPYRQNEPHPGSPGLPAAN